MYCLIYIIGFPSGKSRCSLHFCADRWREIWAGYQKWRKRSVILWRSFERLLELKIYRVSLGNHYRTACRCLVFYFLVRWRGREAYSEEECFFICLFFYFIACAHVGARADQTAISRSASCNKASKHSHSEVYARESSEKIGGDVFSIVLKNLIWDMILPTSVTFKSNLTVSLLTSLSLRW